MEARCNVRHGIALLQLSSQCLEEIEYRMWNRLKEIAGTC